MSIKSSAIAEITDETATPKMFRQGIGIRIEDNNTLRRADMKLNKKGGKVLPQAYQIVENSSVSGAKTRSGEAKTSITEYADEPKMMRVICGANTIENAHKGRDRDSIVLISLDTFPKSFFVSFSAKHLEAIGKKGTHRVRKSPAGKRIIVRA